jgi:hypothetical protein
MRSLAGVHAEDDFRVRLFFVRGDIFSSGPRNGATEELRP